LPKRLQALAAPARVGKRWIELQRLVEVGDRTVEIRRGFVGFAACGIGERKFRIEPNCFVGVGDRAVVIAIVIVDVTPVVVRDGIFRIELDRLTVVGDRVVVPPFWWSAWPRSA
jgi:hypothetical protein